MSYEIYPSDFSTRRQLTHAISIQMTEYSNGIGKIQIVAPVDDYNIRALVEGAMLYNTVRGTTYLLVNVKHDTVQNRITANGYTCNWLLNKRVVAAKKAITTIETGVYDQRQPPRPDAHPDGDARGADRTIPAGGRRGQHRVRRAAPR